MESSIAVYRKEPFSRGGQRGSETISGSNEADLPRHTRLKVKCCFHSAALGVRVTMLLRRLRGMRSNGTMPVSQLAS